jgi:hypothetical protein
MNKKIVITQFDSLVKVTPMKLMKLKWIRGIQHSGLVAE